MPALKSKSNSSLLKARAEQARRGRGIIPSATHPNPQSSPEPISSGTRARVIDTRALEVELEEIKSKNTGLQERNEALEVLITELNIKLEELEIARLKSHQDAESSALRSLELQESVTNLGTYAGPLFFSPHDSFYSPFLLYLFGLPHLSAPVSQTHAY